MSIWGKLTGAGVGFALGGPLGGLLGALAGHYVLDRLVDDPEVVFTIALIALSAKMAKADGEVSDSEIHVFEHQFNIPQKELENVRRVFRMAQQSTAGFEAYAQQVADIYRDRPAVLEDVLDALFHIAMADQVLRNSELDFLRSVADIFGFSDFEFERIKASHTGQDAENPFLILGVTPEISNDDLKKAYRRLVRENHPDTLIARGVPKELVDIANQKVAAINTAYERILSERAQPERVGDTTD